MTALKRARGLTVDTLDVPDPDPGPRIDPRIDPRLYLRVDGRAKRIRVAFLDHNARLSGGEVALLRLLPSLGEQIEPLVILGENGPLVRQLAAAGVQVDVLPIAGARPPGPRATGLTPWRLFLLVRHSRALARRLRELKPDVVHTNSLPAAIYGGIAGRLAGVPVVWHLRQRVTTEQLPWYAVRFIRLLARVLPMAIVANSEATVATLPRGRRGNLPHPPVVPDVVPDPGSTALRTGTMFRVGMVGRIAPSKGQHLFLDAFARAFRGGLEEAWVIGCADEGDDAYASSLVERAELLGVANRLRWRGFRGNVTAELAQLDVLVNCSLAPEPVAQVVAEGMAAGLPVIGSAIGGTLAVIAHETNGLLVPPGDVEALALALLRLADDRGLRQQLGTAARESNRHLGPEVASERLLRIYDGVLHGSALRSAGRRAAR